MYFYLTMLGEDGTWNLSKEGEGKIVFSCALSALGFFGADAGPGPSAQAIVLAGFQPFSGGKGEGHSMRVCPERCFGIRQIGGMGGIFRWEGGMQDRGKPLKRLGKDGLADLALKREANEKAAMPC